MLTAAAAAAAATGGAPKNCGPLPPPPPRGPTMMFNGSGATKEVRILPNGFIQIQTPLTKSCSRRVEGGLFKKTF